MIGSGCCAVGMAFTAVIMRVVVMRSLKVSMCDISQTKISVAEGTKREGK